MSVSKRFVRDLSLSTFGRDDSASRSDFGALDSVFQSDPTFWIEFLFVVTSDKPNDILLSLLKQHDTISEVLPAGFVTPT